jgi:hypothetical protein
MQHLPWSEVGLKENPKVFSPRWHALKTFGSARNRCFARNEGLVLDEGQQPCARGSPGTTTEAAVALLYQVAQSTKAGRYHVPAPHTWVVTSAEVNITARGADFWWPKPRTGNWPRTARQQLSPYTR